MKNVSSITFLRSATQYFQKTSKRSSVKGEKSIEISFLFYLNNKPNTQGQ
jgi:hypothetical protein